MVESFMHENDKQKIQESISLWVRGREGHAKEKVFKCVYNISFLKLVGECTDGLLYYSPNLGCKVFILKVSFQKKSGN